MNDDDVSKQIDALVEQAAGLRERLLKERIALLSRVSDIDAELARLPRPDGPRPTRLADWKKEHPPEAAALVRVGRTGAPLNSRDVLHATASYFGMRVSDVIGSDRHMSVTYVRHVAMYLARKVTSESFPEIGFAFGPRDHTTVMAGVQKVSALLVTQSQLRGDVDAIERMLLEAKEAQEG